MLSYDILKEYYGVESYRKNTDRSCPMLRFLNIGRMVTFLVTLLTTIPLFINYLAGRDPNANLS